MTKKEEALLAYLEGLMTDGRRRRLAEVMDQRTVQVSVLLENVYHPHNISAALRCAECFGLQEVHLITERYGPYSPNKYVAASAHKWLTLREHASPASALDALRTEGYALVATSPHATHRLEDWPAERKTVFLFGTEKEGISEALLRQADATIALPMHGFTESLNISVCVALCLQAFLPRVRVSEAPWRLPEPMRGRLMLDWAIQSVRSPEQLLQHFEREIWPRMQG
jgi:tRNA (guanosine-2'-O-)-methyltransferase